MQGYSVPPPDCTLPRGKGAQGTGLVPLSKHSPTPPPTRHTLSALRGHHQWESHICLSRSPRPLVHPHPGTQDTGLECSVYTSTFTGSLDVALYLSWPPVWGPANMGARLVSDLMTARYNSKKKLLEIPDSHELRRTIWSSPCLR